MAERAGAIALQTRQRIVGVVENMSGLVLPDGTGPAQTDALHGEYAGLYARFVEIVRAGESDVDIAPLRHVADAFLRGRRIVVEPFVE